MTRRKKGFLLWLCSLLPGAGEMYMGFFKQGISIMLLFFLTIAISGYLNLGAIVFLVPVIWFYSFFHVHNIAALNDEEFYTLEDKYIFNFEDKETMEIFKQEKGKKILAGILIVIGILGLWNNVLNLFHPLVELQPAFLRSIYSFLYRIPEILFAVLMIFIGMNLLKGKKKELDAIEEKENE